MNNKIKAITDSPKFQSIKNSKIVNSAINLVTAVTATVPLASILIYSSMVAGVFLPVTAPVALAVGVIGLAGVALSTIMDTIHTRNLRKAQQENNLLVNYRKAKTDQDHILSKNPELSQIIDIDHVNKDTRSKEKTIHSSPIAIKAKAIGKAVLRYAGDIITGVTQGLATSCFSLIKEVTKTALFVALEGKERIRADEVIDACNVQIHNEKLKDDAPQYNNTRDLMIAERKQRTQTMALRYLIADPKYKDMTLEEKKDKFETYKKDIESKCEKLASSPKYLVGKMFYHAKSIVKDCFRSQDPFSEFKDASKLKILTLDDPAPKITTKPTPQIDISVIDKAKQVILDKEVQKLMTPLADQKKSALSSKSKDSKRTMG